MRNSAVFRSMSVFTGKVKQILPQAFMLMLVLAPLADGRAEAVDYRYEQGVLDRWKITARETAVGGRLLDMLNGANASLRVNPRDKYALYNRGYLFGIIGCTAMAVSDLSKAIEVDPYFAQAYTERGVCYMDSKTYDRARMDLDRAVQLNPRSGDALFARGKLMLALDKPYSALTDFRNCQSSAVAFRPALPGELPANHYSGPDYYLGTCYEAMGKPDEALKCYKASIRSPRLGGSGYIHRYSDQPLDARYRISLLENGL